jgi:hypothetical protein
MGVHSALSFGIFTEQFQALLRKECPNIGGVVLRGEILKDGIFADDMALLANTIEELQLLLECLNIFCSQVGMEVNMTKTFGVVFSSPKSYNVVRPPLVLDCKTLTIKIFCLFGYPF